MLQHKNSLLRRMGLTFVLSALQRVSRILSAAAGTAACSSHAQLETCLSAAIHKLLPDFQDLITLRARYVRVRVWVWFRGLGVGV